LTLFLASALISYNNLGISSLPFVIIAGVRHRGVCVQERVLEYNLNRKR
jgi:hypothetical protein